MTNLTADTRGGAADGPILAIETSAPTGGVALVTASRVLAERLLDVRVTYSERLLPAIEAMMADSSVGFTDLAGIAVAVGPGSFTGLRIGIATAQGLALATGLPLVPVGTLLALAWNAWGAGGLIASALDARRGEVYGAAFRRRGGEPVTILEPRAVTPAAFAASLLAMEPAGIVVGPGAPLVFPHLAAPGIADARGAWERGPVHLLAPRAAAVGELGRRALDRGESVLPERLTAFYLRPPAARTLAEAREAR